MFSEDLLEDEYREPYQAWKASPTPQANAQILQTLGPTIDKGIRSHVGEPNPLLRSRARRLALQGLQSYDPKRARLQTHLFNQFKGLKRIHRQQTQPLKVPERILYDRHKLDEYEQEMRDELGRDPSSQEISERLGLSLSRLKKLRSWRPATAEGSLEEGGAAPAAAGPDIKARQAWVSLVYDELPPLDQLILEHSLGLYGKPVLHNQEIARMLGKSPAAITQRKGRIQQLLDREEDLSPFLGS